VIAEFDENSIPSKPRSGVKLCTTILEASKDENSIPNDSTFSDYSDRLLADRFLNPGYGRRNSLQMKLAELAMLCPDPAHRAGD
jgi:hypothetical protein